MANNNKQFGNPEFGSINRTRIFQGLIIIISIIFIARLVQLQLIRGSKFLSVSEAQAIKQEVIDPFRGNIFDRNDKLLVHNEPSFTVKLTPSDFNPNRYPLLCSLLETDSNAIKKTLKQYSKYSRFEPVKIARDITRNQAMQIEEYIDFLPGIEVSVDSKRIYDFDGSMSHLFGYISEITAKQLEKMQYYKPGDIIGKTGIEFTYEDFLRGTKGIKYVAVNRSGQKEYSFNNGKSDDPVINGMDIRTSLDKGAQEKAVQLLEGKRGAVIAIDPNNGEVLVYVSKPDFDLKEMSGRVRPEYYSQLINDPGKPLLNRGIMSAYPPGSIWKMLVGIAGLSEGLITENSTISCGGSFLFGNRSYGCHGAHGAITYRRAIQHSCNVYFYKLALQLGLDRLAKYAEMFRFGQKTFIDIPNENKGFYPSRELLEKKFGKGAANYKGRLVNYGIGQGEINVTPVQMAVFISSIANMGTLYQPHIVKEIVNNITKRTVRNDYDAYHLPINKKYFELTSKGMYDVVNVPGGTGYSGFKAVSQYLNGYSVYGKTGTAQNPHGQDHSWFVCFAKKDGKPVIAVVAMVENAGWGATVAAPIAYNVLTKYISPNFDMKDKFEKDSVKLDSSKIAINKNN